MTPSTSTSAPAGLCAGLFGRPDVDWERIAIRSTGGSNWVCRGLDGALVQAIGWPLVSTIHPARSDEEVKAWRESRQRHRLGTLAGRRLRASLESTDRYHRKQVP